MNTRIAFRADASLQMGSGHVMRCLTLADALTAHGAQCHFISREHPGHLNDLIRQRGFAVAELSAQLSELSDCREEIEESEHASWLGCDWKADADQTRAILVSLQPDWLVVDHYALDHQWETALQGNYQKLMVIDDLADRTHRCDLLLDQNLGRQPQDYAHLVPAECSVLTGPDFALLRPGFATLRDYSLKRRVNPQLTQLLVTMGGMDMPNSTGHVLQALKTSSLPADCRITVIMGLQSPWLRQVREQSQHMPWQTEVLVNVTDMEQRMAGSDLSIGAAGGTSWERCCLGLPTLMVVLADNQWAGARALQKAHAARLIGTVNEIATQLPLAIEALRQGHQLTEMSLAASEVSNGQGVDKVLREMGILHD